MGYARGEKTGLRRLITSLTVTGNGLFSTASVFRWCFCFVDAAGSVKARGDGTEHYSLL